MLCLCGVAINFVWVAMCILGEAIQNHIIILHTIIRH